MDFHKGQRVKFVRPQAVSSDYKGKSGTVYDQYVSGGRKYVAVDVDGSGRVSEWNDCFELLIETKGGLINMVKNLLERLLDADTALIKEKVMNSDGSLNMTAGQVQEALLNTDGFRIKLLEILKAEKEEEESKKK